MEEDTLPVAEVFGAQRFTNSLHVSTIVFWTTIRPKVHQVHWRLMTLARTGVPRALQRKKSSLGPRRATFFPSAQCLMGSCKHFLELIGPNEASLDSD